MRVFRSLYENLHNSRGYQKPAIRDIHTVGPYGKDGKIDKFSYLDGVSILEEQLYPFISHGPKHPSAADLHKTYEGRGIVMTAGNWHFNFALHAIKSLRLINCTLPIQIFYSGPKDLDADKIKQFAALEGVEPVDLSLHFDLAIANPGLPPERMGWAVKPFGMLASRFAEIILVDADALFFQNPENMFEYPHYKDTGALFFMDRTIGSGRCSALDFFEKFLADHPPSSVYRHQGRFGRLLGTHEGESGVILYDKRRNFNGLLAICKANSGKWKETMYKSVHGDKESYWMVHEVLSIPYRWAPGGGGAVGYLLDGPTPTTVRVCGGLYHPDLLHRPLWFNGGLFKNKYTNQGRKWLEVTHWASDFSFKDVKWEWESEEKPFCLIRERNKQGEDWGALTDPEKGSIKAFIDQWEQLKLSA
ncbi:mannosyltransferase putative-domain-containing protein [Phlyctochytrium arcticum]|nr:mannosyltransferase putative-domain-containing protein [Phlyctochytrium arcticum]